MNRRLRTLGALSLLALAVQCRKPTQVTLDLSTDAECGDLDETHVMLGTLGELDGVAPSATTDACEGAGSERRIGDLVVVPRKDKNQVFGVQVVVGVGQNTEMCFENDFKGGCIVARRSLGFVPRVPLELPITLEVDCIDVPCGATETCRKGSCVSAFIEDPLECSDPLGCGDDGQADGSGGEGSGGQGSSGGSPASGGQSSSGGTSSGGASSGGSSSGGAATSGGMGGTLPPADCGNGIIEFPEACDDNNLKDGDGCGSECNEEFIIAANATGSNILLLDWNTGDIVREFAGAPTMDTFTPMHVLQLPNGDVLAGINLGVHRFDIHGTYIDQPISDALPTNGMGILGDRLLLAHATGPFKTYNLSTFEFVADLATTDDGWGLAVLDNKWFIAGGISYGELFLYDSTDNEGPYAIYNGTGFLDLHVTSDRRVLIPDFGGTQTVELTPSVTPSDSDPLGSPTVTRAIDRSECFSAFELPDGTWLVSSNTGLETYNPDTRMLLDTKTTDRIRKLSTYIGPLQNQ